MIVNINIMHTLFINSTDFYPSSIRQGDGVELISICDSPDNQRKKYDGWGEYVSRRNNNRYSLHPIECIKQVNGLHASDGFQSFSKIHHHSDEMMNTHNKYKIIRHIGIHQILITGHLPMNVKRAIQYCFSFGEYFDELLMSVYAANK